VNGLFKTASNPARESLLAGCLRFLHRMRTVPLLQSGSVPDQMFGEQHQRLLERDIAGYLLDIREPDSRHMLLRHYVIARDQRAAYEYAALTIVECNRNQL